MEWDSHRSDIVECIERLFTLHGHPRHRGTRHAPVSPLAHALQCAQLAESATAGEELVAAALLHDIGHLVAAPFAPEPVDADDHHEAMALPLLAAHFGPAVTEPICLHVQAKRYLVTRDAAYLTMLSQASRDALARQGGPMSPEAMRAFESQRHAPAALQLRRWDDLARDPDRRTPPLAHYLVRLERLLQRRHADLNPNSRALDAA
jgi:predicted HD phosphohydrolase